MIEVEFDLYLIRSWDGNSTTNGPDHWSLKADNATLIDTTFSNPVSGEAPYTQNYPTANSTGRTGAVENNTLGYTFGYSQGTVFKPVDSVYHIKKSFTHTNGVLKLDFAALGLQGLGDESWGLANITVRSYVTPSSSGGYQASFKFGKDNAALA